MLRRQFRSGVAREMRARTRKHFEFKLRVVTRTFIARTNSSCLKVYRESLKQFRVSNCALYREFRAVLEFTVLPSLKCIRRESFRLPLTNTLPPSLWMCKL